MRLTEPKTLTDAAYYLAADGSPELHQAVVEAIEELAILRSELAEANRKLDSEK